MTSEISNTDDVIDSRDVIARIEELQELHDALEEAEKERADCGNCTAEELAELDAAVEAAQDAFPDDEASELAALKSLADEAEGYAGDWKYGATLIHESYFVEYCRELVSDIGDMPREIPAYIEIDWDKTAENLKVDYTEVDFDGETYGNNLDNSP